MTVGKNKILTAIILIALFAISVLFPFTANLHSSNDPTLVLEEARRLSMLENWHAAAPVFERAEALLAAEGDRRNQTYARIGRIRARAEEMSQPEVSRLLTEELASPLLRSDGELRIWCLMAKGAVDLSFDSGASKHDYVEALEVAKGLGDSWWTARALGKKGIADFLDGNTAVAEKEVTEAIESAYFHGDIGAEVELFGAAGIGFNEVGRYDEALPLLNRAIELAHGNKDVGPPYLAYQGLAAAKIAQGEVKEARRVLQDALFIAQRESQHGQEAYFLVLFGDAATRVGDTEAAKQYYEAAGRVFRSILWDRGLDDAMLKLARIYRSQHKLEDADRAISIGLKTGPGMDIFYRPRALTNLAELRVDQGRLSEADSLFRNAEDLRESIIIKLRSPIDIGPMAGSMSETYLEHFRLALRQQDLGHAFAILERVRGRATANLLYSRSAEPMESPQEAGLKSQIDAVQETLMLTDDAAKRADLLQTLYQLERELSIASGESALGRPGEPQKPVALSSVQADLGNDEALFEYVIAEPSSFCIAISRDRAEIIGLSSENEKIDSLVETYLDELKEGKSDVRESMRLHALLLAPVLKRFPQTRLIISPDGPLAFLPFEALRDSTSTLVIRSKTISYVPSANEFHYLRNSVPKTSPSRPLLALGDVDYASVRVTRPKARESLATAIFRSLAGLHSAELQPLPESRDEVLSIARTFTSNAVVLLGKDATETAFKRQPLAEYRVIHLAVHAIADPKYPYRASLVLGADSQNDGLLQVREIMRMRLNADLVTLSACETGVGGSQGEAGMTSLVQAFLMGSRGVVGSLWKVQDRWTSELMKGFYQHLIHEDKATALTHAKLDLLERFGDRISPFDWAGFTLWGEGAKMIAFAPN